ncbi:MAG TPA: ABC transporter permease [Gemmatimonadaceae bacterium]|jgi:lipopolysaccharide transport system permease protein
MTSYAAPLTTISPVTQERVIEPGHAWQDLGLRAAWRHRELLRVLVWRNISVRYRQMALGMLWIVLEPLALIGMLFVIFGMVLRLSSEGYPYPIFMFAGLVPFTFFNKAVIGISDSLRENMGLISKIYFPRILLPLSAAARDMFDIIVWLALLVALAWYFGMTPNVRMLLLPAFLLLPLLTAAAVGLWLSVLIVRFRDVRHLLTIAIQLLMYGSPILYSPSVVPPKLMTLYQLNPLYWAIEAFRWALLGRPMAIAPEFFVSLGTVVVLLIGGLIVFARYERFAVDVQ